MLGKFQVIKWIGSCSLGLELGHPCRERLRAPGLAQQLRGRGCPALVSTASRELARDEALHGHTFLPTELITVFGNLHLPLITTFMVLGSPWQLKAYLKIKCHFLKNFYCNDTGNLFLLFNL